MRSAFSAHISNRRDCSGLPDRKCDNSTAYIPTFNLAPNQNHRLRIINTAALAEFQIQIDEHMFALTEVDGTDVLPSYTNRLLITAAQRYSMIVTTNVTTADSFWLRARMIDDCFSNIFPNRDMIPTINAVIQYQEEPKQSSMSTPATLPTSKDWDMTIQQICQDQDISDLVPVPAIPAPPREQFHSIVANFKIGAWRLSRGYFNETTHRVYVDSPMLERYVDKYAQHKDVAFAAQVAFHHPHENVLRVEGIHTIDILMFNENEG